MAKKDLSTAYRRLNAKNKKIHRDALKIIKLSKIKKQKLLEA